MTSLVCVLGSMSASAQPQTTSFYADTQCFYDAKVAYDSLLAREQRQAKHHQEARDNARVNLNTATEGELASLKGIGSDKAKEIMLYREMFGDFARVEDITRVKGIGNRTLEKNRHRLRVQ